MAFKSFFINGKEVKTLAINGKEVKLESEPAYNGLKFTATQANSSVTLNRNGSPTTLNLEFSMNNGSTWQTFNVGTTYALANVGDSICIRAPEGSPNTSGTAQGPSNYHYFSMIGKIAASGNIMSLYDYDNETTTMTYYGLNRLFLNCANLVNSSQLELPATTLAIDCYNCMFQGCTSLTAAPELPATTIASGCYQEMFVGCTSLTAAPELPAMTMASSCYQKMFQGCTSLTAAPELPATTIAERCYDNMFNGCTSLTTAPSILPATTLAIYCYYYMFQGCTSLTAAPELPATTIAAYCCTRMFNGCTSLTTAPSILPATTLATDCYKEMFLQCKSLTAAPELPATTMASGCYYQMFSSCQSLNYVKCAMSTEQVYSGDYHGNWLNITASTGTYESTNLNFDESMIPRGSTTIPNNWNVVVPVMLKLESKQAGSTISLNTNGTPATLHLEMSRNGTTWTPFVVDNEYQLGSSGDYILLRAPASQPNTTGTAQSSSNYHQFIMSGNVEVTGDIMALYSSSGANAMTQNGFYKLFNGCTALKKANVKMKAALAAACYAYMLAGTGITAAPELAQTTLAMGCYQHMFEGCSSLTEAPQLPATTLASYCYNSTFKDCTNITKAPTLLAESVDVGCYSNMFNGCSRLDEVRAAIADDDLTTDYTENWLAGVASSGNFYTDDNDFSVTAGPTTVPVGWTVQKPGARLGSLKMTQHSSTGGSLQLQKKGNPNTVNLLYSLDGGQSWQRLVVDSDITVGSSQSILICASNIAPNIQGMAQSNLNYHQFKSSNNSQFTLEGNIMSLYDCKAETTAMTPYGFYNLFAYGQVIDGENLEMPATTLASNCYNSMFLQCKSLTAAPELPATTMASGCYNSMFSGCTMLNEVRVSITSNDLNRISYTQNWLNNVALTGTFYYTDPNFDTSISRGGTRVPVGWTLEYAG